MKVGFKQKPGKLYDHLPGLLWWYDYDLLAITAKYCFVHSL